MKELKTELGKNIKFYRKKRNLTQEMLAEKSGLSVTAISNIETGYHYPSYPAIIKLLKALEISAVHAFMYDDDDWTIKDRELQSYIVKYFDGLSLIQRTAVLNIAKAMQEEQINDKK